MRINIPSLKEFDDDPEDGSIAKVKKFVPGAGKSQQRSGLFAILPEPKAATAGSSSAAGFLKAKGQGQGSGSPFGSLIPDSVKQSMATAGAGKRPASEKMAQVRAKYMKQESNFKFVTRPKAEVKDEVKSEVKVKVNEDEESSSDEESSDFFSLEKSAASAVDMSGVNLDEYRVSEIEDMDTDQGQGQGQSQGQGQGHLLLPPPSFEQQEADEAEEAPEPPKNREDWMKYLQPGKQKGKVPPAPINIIDVRADDLRPAESDWLKTITDKSVIPPRKANLPGGMSKRKHQITYLAAEAKAREEELQNQWAANRHSRRQTQSKYGF
jgi:proline-rich protein PRCC